MRNIKFLVLHCTATQQTATVESIQRNWRKPKAEGGNGWKSPGYHYIIKSSGEVVNLQSEDKIANGVLGYNEVCIHISYIGGVDAHNKPVDNRTPEQKAATAVLLNQLRNRYPNAIIQGHRDFPNVHKACPSFDVKTWLKSINF